MELEGMVRGERSMEKATFELKPCPFCGGKATLHKYCDTCTHEIGFRCRNDKSYDAVCQIGEEVFWVDHECDAIDTDGEPFIVGDFTSAREAVDAWNTRAYADGQTSDGYHTFDELYYHRTALFACLVATQPRQMAFKSWKHADGTMYEGMFIAGIYTSRGWCTYHCEAKWWPLFDCTEREHAPEWDGHTPSDAIHRLMHDLLPEQEVSGESAS